jgi:hypothetical protein
MGDQNKRKAQILLFLYKTINYEQHIAKPFASATLRKSGCIFKRLACFCRTPQKGAGYKNPYASIYSISASSIPFRTAPRHYIQDQIYEHHLYKQKLAFARVLVPMYSAQQSIREHQS